MLLRILMGNLGEASGLPLPTHTQKEGLQVRTAEEPSTGQKVVHVEPFRVKPLQC